MNDSQGMPIGHMLQAMDFLTYRLIPMEGSLKYWQFYTSDIPGGLYYLVVDKKVVLATSSKDLLMKAVKGGFTC